jgi:hypothetical protein
MSQCCARKKSNLQERCSRRCIVGSQFCGLHHNKKDIITIDEEIPTHLVKGIKSAKSTKSSSPNNNLSHDETSLLQLGDLSRVNLAKISVARLRTTCQFHGLSIKGKTKKTLAVILKEFLVAMAKGNDNITQVRFLQSWSRRCRYREMLTIRGIVVKDASRCVNMEDVITLDAIQDVPRKYLFSYQDPDDKLWYAFDIRSMLSILSNNKTNPYNTKQIPQTISLKAYRLESLLKLQGISTTLEDSTDTLDEKTKNKHRVVYLFHEMDSLDQYTNPDWFLDLSLSKLKKFYKELEDIWNYRLNLTKETKSHIVPPHGKVFLERIPYVLNLQDYDRVQNICLNAIERLITSAEKRSDRVNGCIYVLLALVLVNKNAAMSLPTLYSMVAPDDFLFQQQNEIAVMV